MIRSRSPEGMLCTSIINLQVSNGRILPLLTWIFSHIICLPLKLHNTPFIKNTRLRTDVPCQASFSSRVRRQL